MHLHEPRPTTDDSTSTAVVDQFPVEAPEGHDEASSLQPPPEARETNGEVDLTPPATGSVAVEADESPVAADAAETAIESDAEPAANAPEPAAEPDLAESVEAAAPPLPLLAEPVSEEAPADEEPAPVETVAVGDEGAPPESGVDAVAVVEDEQENAEPAPVAPPSDAAVDEVATERADATPSGDDASAPVASAEPVADSAVPATAVLEDTTTAVDTATAETAPDTIGTAEPTVAEAPAEAAPSAETETGATEPSEPAPAEPPAPKPPKGAHALVGQVMNAPHRVYLLGKVRKAIAAAGEGEQGPWLRETEAYILEQVRERTAAKEALCARAEELQESTAWRVSGDAYRTLFEEWKQVGAAGRELDDQLWARFNTARGTFNDRRTKHFEARQQEWTANRERKEALCALAESHAESTDWKRTAEAMRELQAQWKATGSAGRDYDDALWGRFNAAKQQFFDRRTAAWAEARARKEAICQEAEALKDSSDWRKAADAIKAMQAEWKTIGPAGREHEDRLWQRFRAASQVFFDRRTETFAERTREERENLAVKLDLCARAEALIYTAEPLAAAREAKDLQAEWKVTGPVPRDQSDAIWARFRGACDRIFENAGSERDRQQTEWQIRMREAMLRKREQLIALRESITHDEANLERWRDSLSNLQPGGRSEEIAAGLDAKILDVINRIRGKNERVEDLRTSITDMEAKLRD